MLSTRNSSDKGQEIVGKGEIRDRGQETVGTRNTKDMDRGVGQ